LQPASAIATDNAITYNVGARFCLEIVDMTRPFVLPISLDDLARRYLSGESELALSLAFNTSRATICDRLVKAGVTRRTKSEASFLAYGRMSEEARQDMTAAAHAAVRGKRQTEEHRCKIAQYNEREGRQSTSERWLAQQIANRLHVKPIPQKAIGRYNVDVAIAETRIAVEIFGGEWHATGSHAARFRKRCDYILNRGWSIIIIWNERKFWGTLDHGAVDYVAALHKRIGDGESRRRQEFVIGGTGQEVSAAEYKPHNGSVIRKRKASSYHRLRNKHGRFAK
jgi:very-short-patch-repair endonuclease